MDAGRDREKLASWMISSGFATGHGDTLDDLLAELDWQVKEMRAILRQPSPPSVTRIAWLTKAGLDTWLKGDGPENHVLLRTGNDLRVAIYCEANP